MYLLTLLEKRRDIMGRLTDDDKDYGPLTIGKSTWNALSIMYSSGDDEDSYNSLTVHFGRLFTARLKLPRIIKPFKQKVMAETWDKATIERLGRNFYYNYYPREYGFYSAECSTLIRYGINNRMTGNDVVEHSLFLNHPWSEHELVIHEIYDAEDKLFWSMADNPDKIKSYEVNENVSKETYLVEDFDSELITVKVTRSLMIWEAGKGLFKFIRIFVKPIIKNSLDITFNKEVGKGKGGWKGGLISESMALNENETRLSGFIRYCNKDHSSREGNYRIKYIDKMNDEI